MVGRFSPDLPENTYFSCGRCDGLGCCDLTFQVNPLNMSVQVALPGKTLAIAICTSLTIGNGTSQPTGTAMLFLNMAVKLVCAPELYLTYGTVASTVVGIDFLWLG